jgi:hypothetical protein
MFENTKKMKYVGNEEYNPKKKCRRPEVFLKLSNFENIRDIRK